MKKGIFFAVLTIFFVLYAFGGYAGAEITAGSYSLTTYFGGYTFESEEDLDDGVAAGLGFGYNYTENIGVEGIFNYVDSEVESSGKDADAKVYLIDGLYHFMPDKKFVPYLTAGVGIIDVNSDTDEDDVSPLINFGAGIKYSIAENLQLRGDVRRIYEVDGFDNHTLYTVGLSFLFGKSGIMPADKVVSIDLKVEFDFDKADVKPVYHNNIKKAADFLNKYSNAEGVIEGHTDSIGSVEYNLGLSKRRAENVRKYILGNFGVDPSRLKAVGYGETMPIASNQTKEGRQRNRRVIGTFSAVTAK